jgi:hypothetical protein
LGNLPDGVFRNLLLTRRVAVRSAPVH